MARSSTILESEVGKDPLAIMVAHSERPWFLLHPGLLSPSRVWPTREELILSEMSIPVTVVIGPTHGDTRLFPKHFPTRDEAEASVDAWLTGKRHPLARAG